MPYIPGTTIVHYVTCWSGREQDEAPLCGVSDRTFRTEAGKTHDSAGESMNICEKCTVIAKERGVKFQLKKGEKESYAETRCE